MQFTPLLIFLLTQALASWAAQEGGLSSSGDQGGLGH